MHTKFMLENMKGRDCLGDTGINGKITSNGPYRNWEWTGFNSLITGTKSGLL